MCQPQCHSHLQIRSLRLCPSLDFFFRFGCPGSGPYLNTKTGTEVSATLGFTGNFRNSSTNYTNGINSHLDFGAAQFLNERFFVEVVGYYYQQLTADHGQRAILGPNELRTRGLGLQVGYNFTVGGVSIYTNLRGYTEFVRN